MNRQPPPKKQKQDDGDTGTRPNESKVQQRHLPARIATDLSKVPAFASRLPSDEANLKQSSNAGAQAAKMLEMDQTTPPKKRKAGVASSSSREIGSITNPMLDDQIFNTIFECLDPKELINCTSVCNTWHKGVTEHTWETSATSQEPAAFKALQDATAGDLDAKSMAIGMARTLHGKDDSAIAIDYPDPTISLQDVFLLIQLEAFDTKGAWCKNLSDFEGQNESSNVDFKAEVLEQRIEFFLPPEVNTATNQDTQRLDVHEKIIHQADVFLDQLTITLSLWRRDTGQSICLCRRMRFEESETMDQELEPLEGGYAGKGFRCYAVPGGKTKAGRIARDLCYWGDIKYLSVFLKVEICPKLQLDAPADDAEAAFVDKGDWKYHVSSLQAEFQCLEFDREDIEFAVMTVKTLLLFLDGLDWK